MIGGTRLSVPLRGAPHRVERRLPSRLIARLRAPPAPAHSVAPRAADRPGTLQSVDASSVDVSIDADDDRFARIDRQLRLVGRFLHLPLDVARFDRGQRAAGGLDARQQLARAVLDLAGQLLDVIRAGERIDRVRRRRTRSR